MNTVTIEKVRECAIETLKGLSNHYEIEETEPIVKGITQPLADPHFAFILNIALQKFELLNPRLGENPNVKRQLDVLNGRLKSCLEKKA